MSDLSGSELLLYGGLAVMAVSVVAAVVCLLVFTSTGRKLKKKMEREYGKPEGGAKNVSGDRRSV